MTTDTAKARFTLTIENDTFNNVDLTKFSNMMGGVSRIAGPKARLIKHTESQMVFEEDSAGAWRADEGVAVLDSNAETRTIQASFTVTEEDMDDLEFMDEEDMISEVLERLNLISEFMLKLVERIARYVGDPAPSRIKIRIA